jgi:hypothetical protein
MTNHNIQPTISDFDKILKKVKKLKTDTTYPYSVFGSSSDKLRVYISRLADRGVIVKVSRGYFYKPNNKTVIKLSDKEISLDKSLFVNDMFWNVKDGFKIKTEHLITTYLQNYSHDDLMALYSLFGYSRLLNETLKLYKNRQNPHYKKIREMLIQFETWRLDR